MDGKSLRGAAAVSVVGVVVAALAVGCGTQRVAVTTTVRQPSTAPKPSSFTALLARVKSGIVRIETDTCDGQEIGTGFLLAPRLVATVEHVVDGAYAIRLKQNGRVVGNGTVVGSDATRDVALIESDKPLQGYRFRLARRAPALGEGVAALGFPLGLPLTVTRGSVSGLNRMIPIHGINRHRLVQTDAAVNPGNSGGPLMTDTGQVIGLVDLGTNRANGLAFAVSAEVAGPLLTAWSASPQPASPVNCQGSAPQAAPPPATTAAQQPAVYSGHDFSIDYPPGWVVSHIPEGKFFDTTFTAPGDPTLIIRVDENPNEASASPDAAAAPVIAALQRDPTYREIWRSHVNFQGMDALWWEFENTENGVRLHKVDLFFIDPNGRGWGILTQAPASAWARDAAPFSSYRNTFQVG
jgi:hypothetical protein